jgi:transcriptional/translational regulatory protein YebC/TACO1
LQILNEKIISKFGQTTSSELIWKSENTREVEKETAEKLFKLLNSLEENEDVQNVSSNFEVSEEILASLT